MEKAVILVVESEALIRMEAIQTLEEAGYSVLDACDAHEALRLLEENRAISAVLTDINMSGSMDGLRLAHLIKGRWPPIHLIVTSGRNVPQTAELPVHGRFIRKPYEGRQIVSVLEELIGAN